MTGSTTGFPATSGRSCAEHWLALRSRTRRWSRSGSTTVTSASCATSQKAAALETEQVKRRLTLAGRTGFAQDIPLDRFRADPDAACFISYLIARKNKRRMFTLAGRENPIDHAAEALFARLGAGDDWAMIALVHPVPEVLQHLTQEQRVG